ncbi:hypothetical protein LLH23_00035 [bacterium]|nr:hypothetical protein [bacterium]
MRAWPALLLLLASPLLADELVECSIFKSFYRPTVTIQWELKAPASQTGLYRLSASLRAEAARETLQQKSLARLPGAKGTLAFDTTSLPLGRYAVDVTVSDQGGKTVREQTLLFPVLADPQVKSRLVTVRPSDNMLIVQGKPFFALGIYESPGAEAYMNKLADAGFNLCHVPGGASPVLAKLLDTTLAHGMRVWISASHLMDFSKDAEKRQAQLTAMVQQVGNHPGLLCWESIDEPAWSKQSADGLYDGYCFLRQLDQQHPIWTNHAPRNTILELAHFNRATDMGGLDVYPVPEPQTQSDLPNKTISVVGDEEDKNIAAVHGEKPIFMVLQGFAWAELSKPNPAKPPVPPTFAQSRFMAYDAIVHGANGILYWGSAYTKKPSRFWSELRSLVSELAALRSVLASESLRGTGAAKVSGGKGLRLIHKRVEGYNYALLVNEKPDPVKATVTLAGVKTKQWRRLFEQGTYALQGGKLALRLDGYGVAVLSDNLKFTDRRKDYSAEWVNAANVPEPVLTEPGNLIANPGFEVDSAGDGMPDAWNASLALTATLSDTAHSGQKSLRLQALGGDLAPLAVLRHVDVKADQKYRFSAWVKTEGVVEVRFYTEWVTDTFHAHCLPWTKGPGEWHKLEFEFKGVPDPQGKAYGVVQVRGEGAAYFDDVKLEPIE